MKRISTLVCLVLALLMVAASFTYAAAEAPTFKAYADTSDTVNYDDDTLLFWIGDDRWAGLNVALANPDNLFNKIAQAEGVNIVFKNKTSDANTYARNLLSTGAIPDVMEYGTLGDYYKWAADGLLAEVPVDTIHEYAPNYTAWIEGFLGEDMWKHYEVDGKNYAMGNTWTLGANGMGIGIREDLFKAAGVEIPVTIEDWTAAGEALKANGVYLLGNYKDLPNQTIGMVTGVYGAYPGIFYEKDGQVVYGATDKDILTGLDVLANWYKAGYLDPEYNVLDGESFKSKWNSDLEAATVFYWWAFYPTGTLYGTDYWDITKDNANAIVTHVDFPTAVAGPGGTVQGASFSMGPTFGKNTSIEKIQKYLAFYDKYAMSSEGVNLLMAGEEGVHYTWDDEKGVVRTEAYGKTDEHGNWVADDDKLHPDGVRVVDCLSIVLNNYEVQAYTNFNPVYQPLRDAGNEKGIGQSNIMAGFIRPVWTEKQEALVAMETEFINEYIAGRKTAADHDKFVADWLAAGGQEVLDEANAIWFK